MENDFVMCNSIQYILLNCIQAHLKFAKGSLVTFKSIITRQSQLNNNQASFTDGDRGNTIVSPCVWYGPDQGLLLFGTREAFKDGEAGRKVPIASSSLVVFLF